MARPSLLSTLAPLFLLASVPLAHAVPGAGYGYLAIDSSRSDSPPLSSSFNSNGGAVTVTNVGHTYRIHFGDITEQLAGSFVGGVAHVTALGEWGGYCNVMGWYPIGPTDPRGAGTEVMVRCFDDEGGPRETGFALTFSNSRRPGLGRLAWLWASGPGPAVGLYSYNSAGLANATRRLRRGVYFVSLNGMLPTRGTAQVTAYGPDNGYCNLGAWGVWGPTEAIEVRCFDYTGAPADHAFTLTFADGVSPLGAAPRFAYTIVSDAVSAVPRFGDRSHRLNSTGAVDSVMRSGVPRGTFDEWPGNYLLTIRGFAPTPAPTLPIAMVVAFGSNAHCRPVIQTAYLGELNAWVHCNQPGVRDADTDSPFVAQIIDR